MILPMRRSGEAANGDGIRAILVAATAHVVASLTRALLLACCCGGSLLAAAPDAAEFKNLKYGSIGPAAGGRVCRVILSSITYSPRSCERRCPHTGRPRNVRRA